MWTRPSVSGSPPAARCAHAIAVCGEETGNSKIFVFGGWNGTRMLNDLHLFYYDRMTWSRPITTGTIPGPRAGHTMITMGTKLFIFGGGDGAHYLNDFHVLDTGTNSQYPETMSWSQAYVSGTSPAARSRHTATLVGSKIYLFGGGDDSRVYNDLFIFDTETMMWNRPEIKGEPPVARWGHTSTLIDGERILIFGGHDGSRMLGDMVLFDTASLTWSPVILPQGDVSSTKPSVAPSARAGHTCSYVGRNRVIVFGGGDGGKILNDCWWWDTISFQWSRPQITGTAPLGRCAHTAVLLEQKLILFGGGDGSRRFKDLYTMDIDQLIKSEEKKNKGTKKSIKQRKSQLTRSTEDVKIKMDVPAWLTSLGLKKYIEKFSAQDIDMDTLPFLEESHLEQLGVTTVGAKIKIMNAIKLLNNSNGVFVVLKYRNSNPSGNG